MTRKTDEEMVYELALRGLMAMNKDETVSSAEIADYGTAFDKYAESIDAPLRIAGQTEEVQDLWEEFFDEVADDV